MRRLYTATEFASLTPEELQAFRDGAETPIVATTSAGLAEFGDEGGDRTITYTFSTPEVGRDLHTVGSDAWQLQNFLKNPVFLWAHDDAQPPIGRVIQVGDAGGKLKGTVEYADRDLSPFADMIYRLVRAKYLNAVSASWRPLEWSFSRDKQRPGGIDFSKVDLLEVSQVPLPALPSAIADARRSHGIDTTPLYEWAERLLDSGGKTAVPREELETLRRAAKVPTPAKTTPIEPKPGSLKEKHTRALARAPKTPVFARGLYEVAQLAYALNTIGYCHSAAEYEAALEEDNSEVPGMLGESLKSLGEALIAMTEEEVTELLDHHLGDGEEGEEEAVERARALSSAARKSIDEAKTPRARAWRAGLELARAGRALSASNKDKLEEADAHHERALKHHRALGEHQEAVSGHLDKVGDAHERCRSAHEAMDEHLRAIQDPEQVDDHDAHIDELVKYHRACGKALDGAEAAYEDADDRHQDSQDSSNSLGRSVKAAQRCVRSVAQKGTDESEPDNEADDDLEGEEAAKKERARRARALQAAASG